MECEKCGALLSRMHNFCPRCGTKVSGESESLKKEKKKKKKEVRWVRKGTFDVKRALSRCIGRPAILLGIIGFDGMHHINYIYRNVSPALFLILWSLSEGLHYASEASRIMNIAIVFQWLKRVTKRFLSHFILFVEFLLVLGAIIYTRRVFSYPLVHVADSKTWKESEGMGHMPLEVTWGVRILASVYSISVMRDVAFIMKSAVIPRSKNKIKTK
eukprot:g438.t1